MLSPHLNVVGALFHAQTAVQAAHPAVLTRVKENAQVVKGHVRWPVQILANSIAQSSAKAIAPLDVNLHVQNNAKATAQAVVR